MTQATKTLHHPARSSQIAGDRQISALDLIRFVAALSVMFYHLAFIIRVTGHVDVGYDFLAPYAWPGWIGVEVFFMLSGFIISFSAQHATAASFAKGRFIRLYPTAWICSTFTAVMLLFVGYTPLNLTHLWVNTNLLFTSGPYLDPSYWTLQVELMFYLIVFLLLRYSHFDRIVAVMGGISLISTTCLALYAAAHHGLIHPQGTLHRIILSFVDTPISRILLIEDGTFFAIGTLLWACLLQSATPSRLLLLLISCAGGILEIRIHARTLSSFLHTNYSWLPPLFIWAAALLAIAFAVRFSSPIAALLGPRGVAITRLLGLMTYPLYLIHQQAGYILIYFLRRIIPDLGALVFALAFFIVLSFIIHHYLERPFQRYLRAVIPGGGKPLAEPSTTLP
jgi:peptidoglycan/LPS O-acetylase OafA/YrhL